MSIFAEDYDPVYFTNDQKIERAERYANKVPRLTTNEIRLACTVVRAFDLSDEDALMVLAPWNLRCDQPLSEADLRKKVQWARDNGREPFGNKLPVPGGDFE